MQSRRPLTPLRQNPLRSVPSNFTVQTSPSALPSQTRNSEGIGPGGCSGRHDERASWAAGRPGGGLGGAWAFAGDVSSGQAADKTTKPATRTKSEERPEGKRATDIEPACPA